MNNNKYLKFTFLLFIGFFISIIFTYPLIANLKNSMFGFLHDSSGILHYIFIFQNNPIGAIDKTTNFPVGSEFSFYSNQLSAIFTYFFAKLSSQVFLSYNIGIISLFSLTFLTMFCLVDFLTGSIILSILISMFYTFHPYNLENISAYGYAFFPTFIPLFILAFLKFIEEINIRCGIFFLLTFILLFFFNYYQGYFGFVLAFYFFLFNFVSNIEFRQVIIQISKHVYSKYKLQLFFITLLGTLILCFILSKIAFKFSQRPFDLQYALDRSIEFKMYFIPSQMHFLFGEWIQHNVRTYQDILLRGIEPFEKTSFLGFTALFAIVISLIKFRKNIFTYRMKLLLLLLTLSVLLAIGPYGIISIPFYIILPVARYMSRYHAFTLPIFFSITAICLNSIMSSFTNKKIKVLFMIGIATLMAFEYKESNTYNSLDIIKDMPQAYRYLSQDNSDYAIFELNNLGYPEQIHLQIYRFKHHKKIAYVSYQHLTKKTVHKILRDRELQSMIKNTGFKYIVLIKKMPRVTYKPHQIPWPTEEFYLKDYSNLGLLKIHKEFDDSIIFEFDE